MKKNKNTHLIVFLIIITILAIFLAYWQMKGAIYSPFWGQIANSQESEQEIQIQVFELLSKQDTDKDGLSDFDERFVYNTSVYVPDSDSDAFTDKEEIDAQSNPLDPHSTPYRKPKQEEQTELDVGELTKDIILEDLENFSDVSVEEIKNFLINQAGLSEEIVEKLDDKTIIKLYNETKQETGIDPQMLEQSSNDLTSQFSNFILKANQSQAEDIDILELRQQLINQGLDKEILDSLDDETLKLLFIQSLQDLGL